jgi:hypothetical protein
MAEPGQAMLRRGKSRIKSDVFSQGGSLASSLQAR